MKKLLFALLLTWSFNAGAQVYNNEWIDYSKTYYKFKVGKTGIYRIPQSLLSSAGLGSIPAEEFQLWRNGVQVPLFTSVPSGVLSGSDYIEFWGQKNDGKPDLELYRVSSFQLNDKFSLETDTAAYFLTVNTTVSNNLHFTSAINNVAGNTLPADPWFMYTAGKYFNDRLNFGYALSVGEFLYSSSYDKGEGWSSSEIISNAYGNGAVIFGSNSYVFKNLNAFSGGPAPKFKIKVSGNAVNYRTYKTMINSDSVFSKRFAFFEPSIDSTVFSLSSLNSVSDTVTVINQSEIACYPAPVGCQSDRMVIHQYEITYPRKFNFGGATEFEFTLPANASGNFLQITNFKYNGNLPVLYDLTNGKRYIGDTSASPMVQFALEPSMVNRNLVLESLAPSDINMVSALQTRNFIDYTSASYQGDYMIISSPALFFGSGGSTPVNDYRLYRASAAGGSYNAKIYLIDEITDQFGFGIKKNPAGLRNFLRYARLNYAVSPKHVFIIGRGVNYVEQFSIDRLILPDPSDPSYATILDQKNTLAKINFIPPFGYPASDVLYTSDPGSSLPLISIGRLSVIYPDEITTYLKKVKEYETAQVTMSNKIQDRAWMKNIVHIIGASEPGLDATLTADMRSYEAIIRDTLFGGHVETFSKSSSDYIEQLNSTRLQNLFSEGISVITYFGHSNSNNLEFSLDNPENYNNFKKYPIFFGLGCNAGNFFKYSTARLQTKETLSERYVLSPDKGTIAFVASTHFGIVHYLDIWATRAYKEISYRSYGKTLGEIMRNTAQEVFNFTTQEDFYARCNTEESELHGDPAIRINPHPKPDYVVEDQMVRITPGFVSIADPSFRVGARFLNMGLSPDSNIVVQIKRQFPNTNEVVVLRDTIKGIRYMDSISVDIPIDPNNDKGLNRITVTIDADGNVDEMFENNNSVTKDVFIYEDEARPVSPYNYSIVNKQNIKLVASTANAFALNKQYKMEIDTTELFNSPLLATRTVNTSGGVMEFDPGVVFIDSTVYYWRVAPVVTSGPTIWNGASFVYLPASASGFNQSGFFQHLKSEMVGITMDSSSRRWKFGSKYENLFLRLGSWVTSTNQEVGLSVSVNSNAFIRNTCAFQSVVFNVFDPVTFQPMVNTTLVPAAAPFVGWGLYGSAANNCNVGRQNNFEFRWDSTSNRKRAMDFMKNTIPDGSYVIVRSFLLDPVSFPSHAAKLKYAADWITDESINGTGQSLYHYLKNAGFAGIDSFNRPRQFALVYKKNDPSFIPKWVFTNGTFDNITMSTDCMVPDTLGKIVSPTFGPAKQWKLLNWRGSAMEIVPGDNPRIDIIGITSAGAVDTVMRDIDLSQQTVDVSSISASQYPYLKLRMKNSDPVNNTPYQLKYWRLTYIPVPEGAIAPNIYFKMKDTLDVAETLDFKLAFKNVSEVAFDSLKVRMVVTDRNNVQHILPVVKHRPLSTSPNDTLNISYQIDTKQLLGANYLYVEVNPDNDQLEQYHFNNFAYHPFFVRGDTLNPLLDVTFDNIHILNHDIVSPKPDILIKLKDEAKFYIIDDPSKMKVKLKTLARDSTPASTKDYNFDGDTLQFIPAQQGTENAATAIFRPRLADGKYELQVSGMDMSDNHAGSVEYRVIFEVINKAMISNMLNYPNPFTTSTAFVFTLTGSEVPQNIKIQILTITGKVVREVTKEELGTLHIGRNITEFKWDGTDQYGQKLANGVYLYRVVTNLNGKSLEKYSSRDDNTDKYFNKGYGKMYLMR